MSDKSKLQVIRKDSNSSLTVSKVRSGLIARGFKDATGLMVRVEAPSEVKGNGLLFIDDWLAAISSKKEELLRQAEKGEAKQQHLLASKEYFSNDMQSAVKWCRKAADQGYAPAQCFLGFLYGNEHLDIPGYDLAEAAKWHRKAAYQGYAPAQFLLGEMYDKGEGVTQNYAEAARWYREAADQDLPQAEFNLGLKYDKGQGPAQDFTEAAHWFHKAAEQHLNNRRHYKLGLPVAQFTLGLKYESGRGVVRDYIQAHRWMTVAASMAGGDNQKTYSAARNRVATKMNPTEIFEAWRLAANWYRKAADWGEEFAQFHLGEMYANGQGVSQDYTEAVNWYRKAAEQENAQAQNALGYSYEHGHGVPQDYTEAARWYRKAAEKHNEDAVRWYHQAAQYGYYPAQNWLGYRYYVRQDYVEAAKWLRKAAEQGSAYAQYMLGVMYEEGQGVTQDYVLAHMWANLAASNSSGEDRERNAKAREEVAKKLTSQQLAEAQRLAREWKPIEP